MPARRADAGRSRRARRSARPASSPSRSGSSASPRPGGSVGARTARVAAIVGAAAVAVATTHVAYSRMAVTDVLLTLGVTVRARARSSPAGSSGPGSRSASRRRRSTRARSRLVPVVVAGWGRWRRARPGRRRSRSRAFALTSPFVLIHAGAAWDDISRVQRLARAGWLGFEDDPVAPLAYLDPPLGGGRPARSSSRRRGSASRVWRRRRTDLVLLSFAVVYWLTLMPHQAHFDRYVLPLVPVARRPRGRSVRWPSPIALVALVVPLVVVVDDARDADADRHALDAADAGSSRTFPRDERIAADPSTLPLRGRDVLRLELPGPGRPFDPRSRPRRASGREGSAGSSLGGSVTDRSSRPPTTTRARRRSTTRLARPASPRSRRPRTSGRRPARGSGSIGSTLSRWNGASRAPRRRSPSASPSSSPGAVLLGVEIAASRVLAPTFGSSLFVWGSLIGVVLTGLAIGYWAGGVARRPAARRRTCSSGRSRSAPCSCSRSRSSTSRCWSGSSPGIPGRGSTRCSPRSILFGPLSVVLASVSPIAVRLAASSLERLGRTPAASSRSRRRAASSGRS